MKIEEIEIGGITVTVITAENDTYLTNGETYSDLNGSVYLGKFDSSENWWEVSERPENNEKEVE